MQQRPPAAFQFAPLATSAPAHPVQLCLAVAATNNLAGGPFVLLRERPGARVYLGAICDAEAQVHEWVEIWLQTLELRDVSFSSHQERLTNPTVDARWQTECEFAQTIPTGPWLTGMERAQPRPLLIKKQPAANSRFLSVEPAKWEICRDDAVLATSNLPAYSTSPFRYLHDSGSNGIKTFLATSPDAPTTPNVLSVDELAAAPDIRAVFNPHGGFIRVARFSPLELEELIQLLEGKPWTGATAGTVRLPVPGVYETLETWSADRKGIAFLLHPAGSRAEKWHEVFFLKLALLHEMFTEVRASVKAHQLPLLNLAPASFRVRLENPGAQFPALWTAKCALVKPGQAHSLQIKSTEQRYFVRLGRVEPSPFLPENLGAHSFGIGNLRLRDVKSDSNGTQIEGTLVAEEYLRLAATDLLWFKLPLADTQLEFYAHVHTADPVGPKEARFRTVPARFNDATLATLQKACGSPFQKSPYEIWPLLSSPCDLYSLGILGLRLLLANHQSNLPVIVDEFLSLARRVAPDQAAERGLRNQLATALAQEPKLSHFLSPHHLLGPDAQPDPIWPHVNQDLWLDTLSILLRLFPGAGPQSYCQSFGDVSPLALETVFDQPTQELETLLLRLRSILTPSTCANEEIAAVLQQLLSA
jgi:hypothetical protein